ncbi:MAG TPA: hypothetical protein VJ739_13630 [Gemmataceae bacterium]|nr:hypothetical protein [Gemmataceae bacterium]
MEPAIRELLDATDDSEHAEHPPGFDWSALRGRVTALQPELERVARRPFVLDDKVQDASFFADLFIRRPGPQTNWIDTVFAVRFSNFGRLFTTWSHCETEQLPKAVAAELIAAVERAGFRYVPPSVLDEPYSGRHPALRGSTWWIRFFDYL